MGAIASLGEAVGGRRFGDDQPGEMLHCRRTGKSNGTRIATGPKTVAWARRSWMQGWPDALLGEALLRIADNLSRLSEFKFR